MFKYTPPWMAICQTMDQGNNKKARVSGISVKAPGVKTAAFEKQRSSVEELLQSKEPLKQRLPGTTEDDKGLVKGWLKPDPWVSWGGGVQLHTEAEDCHKVKESPKPVEGDLVVCKEVLEQDTVTPETPTYTRMQVDLLNEEPLVPMESVNGGLCASPSSMKRQEGRQGDLIDLNLSSVASENTRIELFTTHKVALVDVDEGGLPALENGFAIHRSPPSVSVTPMSPINRGDSEGIILRAKKVSVTQDEDLGSSRGSFTAEADGREVWIPSPDRNSKLATIRKEANHNLRAYEPENKPTKLFTADEEEKYQVKPAPKPALENAELLELERRKLIKSQAVKRSSAMAERWGSVEQLEEEEKPTLVRLDDSREKLDQDGRSSTLPFSAEPAESVDTEQINFTSARQQFLRMEKSHQGSTPQSPRLFSPSYRASTSSFKFSEAPKPLHSKEDQRLETRPANVVKAVKVDYNPTKVGEDLDKTSDTEEVFAVTSLEINHRTKLSHPSLAMSSIDDLDSGLGEMPTDCGLGYSSDGGASNEMLTTSTDGHVFEAPEQKSVETPIEREIRLTMEREESLRRERGIKSVSSEEMVEFKTKPMLRQLPPMFSKSKEKNHMAFFVQREIEKETKREEDLRQEGKVKGMYDNGTPKELGERKKVFEQRVDDVPVMPQKRRSMLASFASQESLDMDLIPEDSRGPDSERGPVLASSSANVKMIIKEIPDYGLHSTFRHPPGPAPPNEASKPTEASSGNELRGGKEVEKISHDAGSETSEDPCTVRPLKHRTAFLIEWEIEEEQRREEELQAQRQKCQSSEVDSLTQDLAHSLPPTNTHAATSAPGSSESPFPELPALGRRSSQLGAPDSERGKGLSDVLLRDYEERRGKIQDRKDDISYAGIELSDDINTEVVESTRVARRKNDLALRWEAGLYTNNEE